MRAPRVALSRELPQDRKVARVSGLWRVREGFLLPFCDLCRRRPGQPARARPPRHPALHVAARPPRTRPCVPALRHLAALHAGAAALASPPARAV